MVLLEPFAVQFLKARVRGAIQDVATFCSVAMPNPVSNLIDLAVEDDHLAVEIFKCAEAKVAVLHENRRTNRTGVNAFDKRTGGRDLIKRAHFSSGGETQLRWHDDFAQDPIVVVGRIAQATDVDFRAM